MADGNYEDRDEESSGLESDEYSDEQRSESDSSFERDDVSESDDQHTEVIASSEDADFSGDSADDNSQISDQTTEDLSDLHDDSEDLPGLLGFATGDEGSEVPFDDSLEDTTDDEVDQVRRTSWWKVLGGVAAACLAVALVAWGLGLTDSAQVAEPRNPAAAAEDVVTGPESGSDGEGSGKSKSEGGSDGTDGSDSSSSDEAGSKKQVKREDTGKPPKIAVQVFDTQQGRCPPYFETSVNVYVIKGQVDRGMARLTIPAEGKIRSYPLYEVQGDWSNLIRGIPTSMTAELRIWVEGPNGRTEEWHDITHECPGKKLDDVEKMPKKLKKEKLFSFKIPKFDKLLESIEELETGSDNDKKSEPSQEPADESKDKSASAE